MGENLLLNFNPKLSSLAIDGHVAYHWLTCWLFEDWLLPFISDWIAYHCQIYLILKIDEVTIDASLLTGTLPTIERIALVKS